MAVYGCGGSPPAGTQTQSPKKSVAKAKKKSVPKSSSKQTKPPEPDDPIASAPPGENAAEVPVQKIHRPDDGRPARNDQQLAKLGFVTLKSKHFVLYSDLPQAEVTELPAAVGQLCAVLEAYFGPLPPNRAGTPYQMTGYLMGDAEKFRAAKILTEGPAQPHEGWYLGDEFWWNRQATPYYTRHLMLHEATHCFMHVMPAVDCPPWYVEGMAELFGTHSRDDQGNYLFGTFPPSPDSAAGWNRVTVLQDDIRDGHLLTLEEILKYRFDDFAKLPPYAWSWALCHYLNNHPRYRVPFREVAKRMMDGDFQEVSTQIFQPHLLDLRDEWLLFASQIQYGHDIERSVIEFQPGEPLSKSKGSQPISISSTRGWQSSRVNLVAGETYRVRATGRFTLATTTKPWISEAQGISIRYFAGQPLGRLMGFVRPDPSDQSNRDVLKLVPLGPDTTFVAPHSGTLYLRLNDAWNQLADNSGDVQVEVLPAEEKSGN